ncbi:MAG: hypothetical protein U0794_21070 [Isosphaeraceae bacterium]
MTPIFQAALILAVIAPGFQAITPRPATVADAISLRDGLTLLGQVEGFSPQGELVVVARRAWVQENLPEKLENWQRYETEIVRRARLERRERLREWQLARARTAPPGDPIMPWLQREIGRMADTRPAQTPLMRVYLSAGELRGMARREPEWSRMLRVGWLNDYPDIEEAEPRPLKEELDSRELLKPNDPAWVDGLLPLKSETEAQWRTRRAVTEATFETRLRFVRFRDFILPETGPERDTDLPRNQTELLDSSSAQVVYRSMNSVLPADPVRVRLEVEGRRGRIGAIVSRVDWATDFRSANAETGLWVRQEGGQWSQVLTRKANVDVNEPPDPLGPGPREVSFPIRTTVKVLEMFGAAPSLPAVSDERLGAATAAQRALGRARAVLSRDLGPFVLPVTNRP